MTQSVQKSIVSIIFPYIANGTSLARMSEVWF